MDRRTFGRSAVAAVGLAVTGDGLLSALGHGAPAGDATAGDPDLLISEGFEAEVPDLHTYRATYAVETLRAHGGTHSLRVTPTEGSGGAYFRLDGIVDGRSDYEFSTWVWAAKTGGVQAYISASDGKQRHTKGHASGGVEGQWVLITGVLRGREWRETDRDVMLALTTSGESWFDDVVLRKTHLPDPPIETYPVIARALHSRTAQTAVTLQPGAQIELDGRSGVLAAGLASADDLAAGQEVTQIPADGMLAFAVEAPRAMYVTGAVELEPDADLRPGLRATVLCDDTVVAAPMVNFASGWQSQGNALTGPAPVCCGDRPPAQFELASWLMPAGRHTIMIAGPHFRGAGELVRLRLRGEDRAVREPLYQFALLSDTHLGTGRAMWMNDKLNGPAQGQLAETLAELRAEGVRFAVIAGDMTDGGTRPQIESLARVCGEAGMPVFGCMGNHDSFAASGRVDALSLCGRMFPSGATDYAFCEGPLRFVVLDGSYWKQADGSIADSYDPRTSRGVCVRPEQIQWLRETLAADTQTPTLFIWHYPLCGDRGLSTCGYRLPSAAAPAEVFDVVASAPNVRGALCGHTHWNAYKRPGSQHHLVNPAFCEWPNAYRVLRVYSDRVEWELRQVRNRGFVRESFVVPKALSWMISTTGDDLTGQFPL